MWNKMTDPPNNDRMVVLYCPTIEPERDRYSLAYYHRYTPTTPKQKEFFTPSIEPAAYWKMKDERGEWSRALHINGYMWSELPSIPLPDDAWVTQLADYKGQLTEIQKAMSNLLTHRKVTIDKGTLKGKQGEIQRVMFEEELFVKVIFDGGGTVAMLRHVTIE